jgi:hypothetical protein
VTSKSNDNLTIEEIRKTFVAMVRRLQTRAEKIPDQYLQGAMLIHLEIFLAHARKIDDPDELLDFCIFALAKMKYSIDSAQADEGPDLGAVIHQGLFSTQYPCEESRPPG